MIQYGYCCINLSLRDQHISTNRGMIKATFKKRGLSYAGELAQKNLEDLYKILQWNVENDILVYRMSSDIFPWISEYNLYQLPNFSEISNLLLKCGGYAMKNGIRLSFHPGQFNVLPSPNEQTYLNTVKDLNNHSTIMNHMGLPQSHMYPINIHVGATYGDKAATLAKFRDRFSNLNSCTQRRLVVENDDKINCYSVKDLYDGLYKHLKIPITFDYHHHNLCTGGMSTEDALKLALSTWTVRPITHYSSSKKLHENSSINPRAHADYVYEEIPHMDLPQDIEIEAKAKDLAVKKYKEAYLEVLNEVL